MQPTRGLSLTDLVNHDDTPPLKTENEDGVKPDVGEKSVTMVESDETDTDDEPGEIVFENTKFKFDDEEPAAKTKPLKPTAAEKKGVAQNEKQDISNSKAEKPIEQLQDTIEKKDVDKEMKGDTKEKSAIKEENKENETTHDKEVNPSPKKKTAKEEKKISEPNAEPETKPETTKQNGDIFQQKSSNVSVKNNIKKDLKVLNELSSTSLPKRYNIPPVWARKWKPTVKALQAIDSNNLKLDDSILSFIPEDDLTKSVQDWVYATLISVEPELRQFIEVEMKYGVIIDPTTSNRVNPPVSSQCVFNDLDSTMKPDIDERVFDEFNRYMKSISSLNENMGKFNIIDSHTSDLSYRIRTHTERPKFLRITSDVSTGRIADFIEKRKISQLLLYSPKDSYDTKISISLELPVPESDPPEKYKHHTPTGNRIKSRTSYIHNDSCTRFDITKVESKPIQVNKKNDKPPESDYSFEVELEINTPALLNSFDNIHQDSKEYAAIIRTFLNNGTIVRRKLSSLSYDIFQGSNKL